MLETLDVASFLVPSSQFKTKSCRLSVHTVVRPIMIVNLLLFRFVSDDVEEVFKGSLTDVVGLFVEVITIGSIYVGRCQTIVVRSSPSVSEATRVRRDLFGLLLDLQWSRCQVQLFHESKLHQQPPRFLPIQPMLNVSQDFHIQAKHGIYFFSPNVRHFWARK